MRCIVSAGHLDAGPAACYGAAYREGLGKGFLMSILRSAALSSLMIASSPAAAQQAEAKPEAAPEKLVCKKVLETGSFVKATKVCLTAKQWRRSATTHREFGEKLQDELRSRPGT